MLFLATSLAFSALSGCTAQPTAEPSQPTTKPEILQPFAEGLSEGYDSNNSYPLVVDGLGFVYTIDKVEGKLLKISPSGMVNRDFALLDAESYPVGVTIDSTGNLYTANFGSDGSDFGEDNGECTGTGSLSAITAEGKVTPTFATYSAGVCPQAITYDPQNKVIYTANSNGTVSKIFLTGEFIQEFARLWPTSDSSAGYPTAITVDSVGNIFVTDSTKDSLSKISQTGTVTSPFVSLPSDSSPRAVVIEGKGNIYTANARSNTLSKIDSTGTITKTVNLPEATGSLFVSGPVGAYPTALAVDQRGNVYTCNLHTGTISLITSAGELVPFFAQLGDGSQASPSAITISPSGRLFVADKATRSLFSADLKAQ